MSFKTTKYGVATILFIFILLLFIPFAYAFALEATYSSLFSPDEIQFEEGLGPLFNQIFRIGLTAAAILAVFFIAVGGFQYMTTDAISGQTEGRKKIQDATFGLLLALMIFIILNTINPGLLNLSPNIKSLDKDGGKAATNFLDRILQGVSSKGGGVLLTPSEKANSQRRLNVLKETKFRVDSGELANTKDERARRDAQIAEIERNLKRTFDEEAGRGFNEVLGDGEDERKAERDAQNAIDAKNTQTD